MSRISACLDGLIFFFYIFSVENGVWAASVSANPWCPKVVWGWNSKWISLSTLIQKKNTFGKSADVKVNLLSTLCVFIRELWVCSQSGCTFCYTTVLVKRSSADPFHRKRLPKRVDPEGSGGSLTQQCELESEDRCSFLRLIRCPCRSKPVKFIQKSFRPDKRKAAFLRRSTMTTGGRSPQAKRE